MCRTAGNNGSTWTHLHSGMHSLAHTSVHVYIHTSRCRSLALFMPWGTSVHIHMHLYQPTGSTPWRFWSPRSLEIFPGKAHSVVARRKEEGGAPSPSWIRIPTMPAPSLCSCASLSEFPFLLVTRRLLRLAWKGTGERGGRREAREGPWFLGPLGSTPHTGPGSGAAQQCSRWKQHLLTVAIDYGKIVCG